VKAVKTDTEEKAKSHWNINAQEFVPKAPIPSSGASEVPATETFDEALAASKKRRERKFFALFSPFLTRRC